MSNVVPFDTLALAQALREEAGLEQKQAEGFARVLSRAMVGDLATKDDVKTGLAAAKADLDANRIALKADLAQEAAAIRAEIRTAVADAKTDIIKWLFGSLVAQTGLIIAAIKLFSH